MATAPHVAMHYPLYGIDEVQLGEVASVWCNFYGNQIGRSGDSECLTSGDTGTMSTMTILIQITSRRGQKCLTPLCTTFEFIVVNVDPCIDHIHIALKMDRVMRSPKYWPPFQIVLVAGSPSEYCIDDI